MTIHAQVDGIGTLEFPDGTDSSVIQSTVKKMVTSKGAAHPNFDNTKTGTDFAPLYSALKKADAAGDTAGAKKLADYIRTKSSKNPAASEDEEFEFRARAEAEYAHAQSAGGKGGPQPEPGYGARVGAAGRAYDAAVGNQGKIDVSAAGARAAGRTGVAALEDVAAMGSGLVGDVAGAATSVFSQDPKRGESVRNALTYQPRTAAGQAGQQYLGELASPIGRFFDKPRAYLEEHGHPIAAQAARAATDVLPLKVPRLARAGAEAVRPAAAAVARAGEDAAAVRTAEQAPRASAITSAKDLGIRLPPSQAGRAGTSLLETAGGKIQTEQHLSRVNAKVMNRKAAADIGLSDREPLTEENIERAKQPHFDVYDRVKKAGRIEADDEFRAGLKKVHEQVDAAGQDYPEDLNERVVKEVQKFDVPSADASSMLEKIKSLRGKASKNLRSSDAETFELGLAQKKIATSMEDLIERQVKDPTLIADFRRARQQLAKIYNVEDAVSKSGNVNAAVLARQLKRGVPLSGNLRAIAEVHQAFPKVTRHVEKLGGHAPLSTVDYLLGGAAAAVNPAHIAGLAAGVLARPAARAVIASKPFQRAAIRAPGAARPSVAARAARRIADYLPPVDRE